jgi:sec-independent protein translocase protein TatB
MGQGGGRKLLGIFEIILFLVIALIVIPPDDLPQVMRAAGKILRELRLASNTVMREISGALGDDAPLNILPPRFDDPHPPAVPRETPSPPAPAFLAPQPQQPPLEGEPSAAAEPAATEPAATATAADTRISAELPAEPSAQAQPPTPPSQPEAPEQHGSVPPAADKP